MEDVMGKQRTEAKKLRDRAERIVALAMATGAKAQASPDYRKVFIERRDGSRETVRLAPQPH
jgi:hypothetical protein